MKWTPWGSCENSMETFDRLDEIAEFQAHRNRIGIALTLCIMAGGLFVIRFIGNRQ
jgi:hypothetical protein